MSQVICIVTFEGKKYGVTEEADMYRLPDGRIIRCDGWLESFPAQAQGRLVEIPEATVYMPG